MYVPQSFSEATLDRILDLMESESFAILASVSGGLPFATHLPLSLDRNTGKFGTIRGHLARANPQWRDLAGQQALAIYSGPHCYISPSWYEEENTVPTWNYVAVHAMGRIQLIEDPESLWQLVSRMTDYYEKGMPSPWSLPVGSNYDKLLAQIVGFEIEIETIEGKWKLNQNQSIDRQRRVIRRLRKHGGVHELAIAELMERNIPRH